MAPPQCFLPLLCLFIGINCNGNCPSATYPPPGSPNSQTNRTVDWFACDPNPNITWPVTCGTLTVPLDYTDLHSNKTLDLKLVKYNATKSPVKGSILFNPGGPGEGTREFLGQDAPEMLINAGGHYDLIGFDVRGVGETLPCSCFNSDLDRSTQFSIGFVAANGSDTTVGLDWTAADGFADTCYEQNEDIGEYLGAAAVARDMMQIVDAIEEDGLLRYYGFSYGTILGATAAAMFPDRIDRMVLDGVVNAHEWYAGANREEIVQADDTFRAWLKDCVAAPSLCPLAKGNITADGLYDNLVDLLQEVKYNPILLGSNITTGLVQYNTLKETIYPGFKGGLKGALGLAVYLNSILQRNLTQYELIEAAMATPSPPLYPNLGEDALYGIECADSTLRTDRLDTFDSLLKIWYQSYWGGELVVPLQFSCARWKMSSKEIYNGSFKAKTKAPILFVSSPYDPATPMVSARNMSAGFEGSVVLQHNHIGHCTILQPSKCAIDATRNYFTDGTLPSPNTVCEPDFNIFANVTIAQIYNMSAQGELGN